MRQVYVLGAPVAAPFDRDIKGGGGSFHRLADLDIEVRRPPRDDAADISGDVEGAGKTRLRVRDVPRAQRPRDLWPVWQAGPIGDAGAVQFRRRPALAVEFLLLFERASARRHAEINGCDFDRGDRNGAQDRMNAGEAMQRSLAQCKPAHGRSPDRGARRLRGRLRGDRAVDAVDL